MNTADESMDGPMNEPLDAGDVATLTAVAGCYGRLDPVPARMTERIKFALTVQSLAAEVAQLVEARPLVVRGTETSQIESVTFTAGRVSLMVSITPMDGHVRIDGWVTRGGARVDADCAGRTLSATADEHGRFVLDSVPRGSVMFVIHLDADEAGESPVVTPRIEV